jgi:hypothetical protein
VNQATSEQDRANSEMSTRAAGWLAWSLCVFTLLLLGLAGLLILLGASTFLPGGWTPWRDQAVFAIGIVGAPILGALIASRRPANVYGWLWLGLGLGWGLLLLAQVYAAYALVVVPGSLPAPQMVGTTIAGIGWLVALTITPLLLLLFPSGRLPSQRWKVVVWAVVVAAAVCLIVSPFASSRGAFTPAENPFGIGGVFGEGATVLLVAGVMIVFIAVILAALSLIFRFRRALGVERQQIKWFAYAASLLGGSLVLSFLLPELLNTLLYAAALFSLYMAVGIAILRYRLYDIDLLINRTLVYGSLTVLLAGVCEGSIVLLQEAFRALTGQHSGLAIVASTLVIAALFNPLRRRIQAFIDRLFYRRKYDAVKTLEAFSSQMREETDLDALSSDVVGVVRRTVQPAHVSLWLRPDPEPKARSAALRQFGHDDE